jgi:hypothetical protein
MAVLDFVVHDLAQTLARLFFAVALVAALIGALITWLWIG